MFLKNKMKAITTNNNVKDETRIHELGEYEGSQKSIEIEWYPPSINCLEFITSLSLIRIHKSFTEPASEPYLSISKRLRSILNPNI